eukprot:gene17484-23789_t
MLVSMALAVELQLSPSKEGAQQSSTTRDGAAGEVVSLPPLDPVEQEQPANPGTDAPIIFTLGKLIGQGAVARVYQAKDENGELIAVKQVALAHQASVEVVVSKHIKSLEKEVSLLKNLRMTNLVQYLGTSRTEDTFNIFLEFVYGGSIASLIEKFGPLPESIVRVYTKQILRGLEYLHQRKIKHVDGHGTVKLAGFGASKQIEDLASIKDLSIVGIPFWMAPEVIKQTGHGRPADIWSTGCVVIEMASGKPPWINCHIALAKQPPDFPEHLSAEAKDFLLLCFNHVPKERPNATRLLKHPWMLNTIIPSDAVSRSLDMRVDSRTSTVREDQPSTSARPPGAQQAISTSNNTATIRDVAAGEVISPPPLDPVEQEQPANPGTDAPIIFTLGKLLDAGAFARVYQAMDENGKLIAVKQVALTRQASREVVVPKHIMSLEKEVSLLKNLRMTNIVQYLGTSRTEDTFNIFLEFVPGGSIASLIQKYGPLRESVGGSILVDGHGTVKLAGFGASKQIEDLASIKDPSIVGTPFWMAPEMIKQTGHGPPADIWSTGCVVIEMASGKPPWSNCYTQVPAMFHIASTTQPPEFPEHLSAEAKDFLLLCFNRVPKERPNATRLLKHPWMLNTVIPSDAVTRSLDMRVDSRTSTVREDQPSTSARPPATVKLLGDMIEVMGLDFAMNQSRCNAVAQLAPPHAAAPLKNDEPSGEWKGEGGAVEPTAEDVEARVHEPQHVPDMHGVFSSLNFNPIEEPSWFPQAIDINTISEENCSEHSASSPLEQRDTEVEALKPAAQGLATSAQIMVLDESVAIESPR